MLSRGRIGLALTFGVFAAAHIVPEESVLSETRPDIQRMDIYEGGLPYFELREEIYKLYENCADDANQICERKVDTRGLDSLYCYDSAYQAQSLVSVNPSTGELDFQTNFQVRTG